MAALLLDIKEGDEVIVPSYTFVSTANAFLLRKAKLVFADSLTYHPNVDPADIKRKISKKTVAIVVVHYAGVACEMDSILKIARDNNLYVVEDAAQAIESTFQGKQLGTIGDLGTFSFHETKNISCGEGGLLLVNNRDFLQRSEIIWEKGTNRSAFFRGEIDRYNWVDIGSSFLPSEINAAFLRAQLESLTRIQERRFAIWTRYYERLSHLQVEGRVMLPFIPDEASHNAHIFYLRCKSEMEREYLRHHLLSRGIHAVTHYLPLEQSPFFTEHNKDYRSQYGNCINSRRFSGSILRLPLYYDLSDNDVDFISNSIGSFFQMELKEDSDNPVYG
jgi:dTDP-4-amino-4,6-dideoxygalactose transaminase